MRNLTRLLLLLLIAGLVPMTALSTQTAWAQEAPNLDDLDLQFNVEGEDFDVEFQRSTETVSVAAGIFSMIMMLVWLAVVVIIVASMWIVFTKAGRPGWAAIIPIYNGIVLLEIIGRPLWWILLFLIPCVNFVLAIIVSIDLAKSFGKDALFGIGLWLLGFIFFPILAFGDAKYQGPAAAQWPHA
jgi:type IV secretory pathway TrbD component